MDHPGLAWPGIRSRPSGRQVAGMVRRGDGGGGDREPGEASSRPLTAAAAAGNLNRLVFRVAAIDPMVRIGRPPKSFRW
jgi:hypothetical protein